MTLTRFVINSFLVLFAHMVIVVLDVLVIGIALILNAINNPTNPYFVQTVPTITVQIILSVFLCFFCGRLLIHLEMQWLNFLSVCFIPLILLLLNLPQGPDRLYGNVFILNELYFRGLHRFFHHSDIARNIYAFLPSLIIWLGMLHKHGLSWNKGGRSGMEP